MEPYMASFIRDLAKELKLRELVEAKIEHTRSATRVLTMQADAMEENTKARKAFEAEMRKAAEQGGLGMVVTEPPKPPPHGTDA